MHDNASLIRLKEQDPDLFIATVLSALRRNTELAVTEPSPREKKHEALDKMLARLEELEKYEDCAFIIELKKKIDGQV